VLGPGPLAETFPHPLAPLEVDLWLAPMRTAMRRALLATGASRRSVIDRSPVVTAVRGRPAVDLALIGAISSTGTWRRLAPRALARRLATAWRVGRLRVALPTIVATVATSVDDDLSQVGSLTELDDRTLVELLHRTRSEAATVHTFEMLCGMIQHAPADAAEVPLPTVAVRAIARLRADGLDDAAIIARSPEVLALTVPAIGSLPTLPPVDTPDAPGRGVSDTRSMTDRDELRLRIRWLQELGARAATEIGRRAAATGAVDHPSDIRWATLTELDNLGNFRLTTEEVNRRAALLATDPLPVRFILDAGRVQPLSHIGHPRLHRRHRSEIHGMPASSGRAMGTVVHDLPTAGEPTPTAMVLVTEHLDPTLATALPAMAGLVAETGSALSHLAILAREAHLPTVVAVTDARRRLPCGARVVVDGASGDVWVLGDDTHPHGEAK
jgi:pyruvate,water dikinase